MREILLLSQFRCSPRLPATDGFNSPQVENARHAASSDIDHFRPSSTQLPSSLVALPIEQASLGQMLSKMATALPPSSISAIPSPTIIRLSLLHDILIVEMEGTCVLIHLSSSYSNPSRRFSSAFLTMVGDVAVLLFLGNLRLL